MIRALDKWLVPWLKRRVPLSSGPAHVFVAVCDHFEPLHASDKRGALSRIQTWQNRYPKLVAPFRDVDGVSPKHTFFFPIEQYDSDLLEPLAGICQETGSEVEIHLHHDNDTAEGLRTALEKGKDDLCSHGLLSYDREGKVRYGFIHGNWALNHSHPQGKGCGVEREIPILRSTGCYADFTMPSAPSPTQSRFINGIAYLDDLPGAKALDLANPVRFNEGAERRDDPNKLLMIHGPLALNWKWRKFGIIPRIENGDLTGANPPTLARFQLSCQQGISVQDQSNWIFLKFHTHGGIERNFDMLLGKPMHQFYESLQQQNDIQIHYTTAREMANLVHAAEEGCTGGDPGQYRDYLYKLPV